MRRDDRHFAIGHIEPPRTLRAIDQQQPVLRLHEPRDRRDILSIAGFRIDLLNRHQRPFALDRLGQIVVIERAIAQHGQAFGSGGCLQDAVMLHRAHQPGASLRMVQRQRCRLACSGSEDHLALPAERRFHPVARILEQAARLAAGGVRAGRIGPVLEALLHRRPCFGAQRRGGSMVEIDAVRDDDTCSK